MRIFSKKFKEEDVLGPAYIFTAIGVLLYLVPDKAYFLLFIVPLASLPNALQMANFSSLLSKKTPDQLRGEVMGINSSVNSLGQAIPPLLAGAIAALTASYVPIIFGALIVCLAGIVFIYKVKKVS